MTDTIAEQLLQMPIEERLSQMTQAVGLATTFKPALVMRVEDPIGMMQEVEAYLKEREEELLLLREGMERAWGLIANAGGGDWSKESAEWHTAAMVWRDQYWHPFVQRMVQMTGRAAEREHE